MQNNEQNQPPNEISERIEVLFNINQMLTSSLDFNEILTRVLQECVGFFQSDAGMILLYDEERKQLIPHNYYGIDDKAKQISLKIGEGISGKVFQSNEAVLLIYPDDVQEAMEDINEDDKELFEESIGHWNAKPYSVMCAPLLYKNKNLGVLTLDFFEDGGKINKHDLRLLQIIASQAAIAYQNAITFENEKKIVEGLNETISANTMLSNTALQGKGINHICETISKIIKLPVWLFDSLLYTRYRSEDFNHPVNFLNYVYDTYFYHNSIIVEDGFAIYPIKTKNETLGFFIIELFEKELPDFTRMSIEHGLNIIALELIKEKEIYYTKVQVVGEIFNEYFVHKKQSTLIQRLEKFGVSKDIPCYYILFDKVTDVEVEKIYNVIFKESIGLTYKPLLTSKGAIYFSKQDKKDLKNFLSNLDKILRRFKIEANMLVGRKVNSIVEIESSYQDALSMLGNDSLKSKHIILYDDLTIEKLFMELEKENIFDYIELTLKDLINDDTRSKQLLETLSIYIDCHKDPHKASENLYIHINTLYYRLKVIENELDIKFSNQEDWLNIHLAVKLLELNRE